MITLNKLFKYLMVCILNYMVIVNLESLTHKRLKKVKKEMKRVNKPVFKINNNTVINHALKKVEGGKLYEISDFD